MIFRRLIWACACSAMLLACKKDKAPASVEPFQDEKFNIFPKPTADATGNSTKSTGWVGDVMPHFVNGQFELFFLHDATNAVKQSSPGQHPIHKFSSKNLLDFSYDGEVIPYGDATTQDQLVGTGSLVKAGSTYYFYYTGFNSSSGWLQNNNPGWTGSNNREAIMYATSTDMKSWTKKRGFSLKAPEGYAANDFRDPYVFFNDEFNEYWMVVSTQQSGRGVILVYKTQSPESDNWQLRGPLNVEGNYLMLECADIFKMGDKYYMTFAEDWSSTPGTHYRVAASTAGPWIKPTGGNDMFDGHQFYAGRVASNGASNYTFGWAHRRDGQTDNGNKIWGGNLISHELIKQADGRLGIKSPAAVQQYFTKEADVAIKAETGTVSHAGANYIINGSSASAIYKFAAIDGTVKIQGSLSVNNSTGTATIGFNTQADNSSSYQIKFEPAANRIAAYNNGTEVTRVPFNWQAGKSYTFSVVIDNSVAILYVNDEVALTNRIYSMQNNMWSLKADGLTLSINNLKVLHH